MTYAKYRDDLILRVNDNRWINAGDPLCADDLAAYQAWTAAGGVPLDGNAGCPSPVPSRQIAATDSKMARIGEDIIELLIRKGIIALAELPISTQAMIAERKALRASIASE